MKTMQLKMKTVERKWKTVQLKMKIVELKNILLEISTHLSDHTLGCLVLLLIRGGTSEFGY